MTTISHSCLPPQRSLITRDLTAPVDYADSFSVCVPPPAGATVDELAVLLLKTTPRWVDSLVRLRDRLVRPLGLKTADDLSAAAAVPPRRHEVGDRLGFFTVSDRSDDEVVFAEDDKHLYFRTSVLVHPSVDGGEVVVHSVTLVVFHNRLGRLYFFFVKPFHKLIIKSLLKRLRRRLLRRASTPDRAAA